MSEDKDSYIQGRTGNRKKTGRLVSKGPAHDIFLRIRSILLLFTYWSHIGKLTEIFVPQLK